MWVVKIVAPRCRSVMPSANLSCPPVSLSGRLVSFSRPQENCRNPMSVCHAPLRQGIRTSSPIDALQSQPPLPAARQGTQENVGRRCLGRTWGRACLSAIQAKRRNNRENSAKVRPQSCPRTGFSAEDVAPTSRYRESLATSGARPRSSDANPPLTGYTCTGKPAELCRDQRLW
jgi:hypothetical protein